MTLWLPATDAPPAPARPDAAPPVRRGAETVLVVEDDDPVREVTCALLRDLGYEVLEARGGTEALSVLDAGHRIHVMMTDIVMPGPMRGSALAREAAERHPDLRIVFLTGYADAAARIELGGRAGPILRKPFTGGQLASTLRDVLGGGGEEEDAAPVAPAPKPAPSPPRAATPAGPRVLLVEDEMFIRMDTAEMLADLGCAVTEAGSAEEALERLGPGRFDLLITDVSLGEMTGTDLARAAIEIDPGLRIAFATGARAAPEVPGLRADFLEKPFTDKALARVVRGSAGPRGMS